MLKSTGKEGRPNFQLDCDKFAAEQLRQKHVSNVYRLTREERLRIMDPDYEERQRASTGFVLDGERYANSNPRTKEAFPYKPFFRQNENSDDPSSADSGRRRRRRGRRRPAGTVGYDVSSADLKRKLEFDKARPRIDAQGQVIKHEPKKVITYKLPDYSKVSSKIGQSATSPYKRHGGNVRVKFGVAKKRNLPPLTPAAPDREATYLRRKELLREYTRKLDPSGTSPEKRRSPGRGPQPDGGASPTHHSNKQRREQHGSDSGSTTGPNTTTHAATSSNRSGENDEYSRHNDVRRATDQTPASPESPTTINDHKDADVHASSYANVAAHGNSNDDDDDDDDDDGAVELMDGPQD